MKAIILAGGFGTRLKDVVPDLPKPMADISGTPFLEILVKKLLKNNINEIIFSLHYKSNIIINYFSSSKYKDKKFHFIVEDETLGTGGAIKNVLEKNIIDENENFMVLNGDTYVEFSYQDMIKQHVNNKTVLTMLLRKISDSKRYGVVKVNNEKIISYNEKNESGEGLINAGVYIINSSIFENYDLKDYFSFEKDFLGLHMNDLNANYFISNNYFIDIGIKKDYFRAQKDLTFD